MKSLPAARDPAAPFLVLALWLVCLSIPVAARAQTDDGGIAAGDRVFGLSLIWKEAAYNFPYFGEVPELDWDAAYRDFVPRVLGTGTTLEYYRELQRFTALLHDGHSRVHFPDSIIARHPFSSPWVELESIGGRPMVANTSRELADSLPGGSEIVEVEGLVVDAYLDRYVLPYVFAAAPHSRRISAIEGSHTRGYGLLVGPAGTQVAIVAVTANGERVGLTLSRDRFTAAHEWVVAAEARTGAALEFGWIEPGIARVALNSFSDGQLANRLDSILPELRTARGIVLDLRQNGGGSDVVATEVMARFTDLPLIGTASRIRVNDAYYRALGSFGRAVLERALPPDNAELVDLAIRNYQGDAWRTEPPDTIRPAFKGDLVTAPVAVLIGRGTGSAAENFVIRIPEGAPFVTVGAPTAGSTGQPLQFALPGGGSGQVVTRGVLLADGTPIVRSGIMPDVPVEPTIDQVRRGDDPVLDEAVRIVKRLGG